MDRRRVRITLPHISGSEALLVVEVLDRLVRAIWRSHGDAMADAIGRDHPRPEMLCDPTARFILSFDPAEPCGLDDDDDIPF